MENISQGSQKCKRKKGKMSEISNRHGQICLVKTNDLHKGFYDGLRILDEISSRPIQINL